MSEKKGTTDLNNSTLTTALTAGDIEKLNTGVSSLNEAISKLVKLAEARQSAAPVQTPVKSEEPDAGDDDDDIPTEIDETALEAMSRKDLISLIEKRIGGHLGKNVIKPLMEKLDTLQNTTASKELTSDIKEFAAKTPDFWEWREEMAEIAKETNLTNPKRLYQLARQDHPDKAKQLDDKRKEEDDKKREASEGKKPKPKTFGGLPPAGRQGDTRAKAPNWKDASEAAWEEAVAASGGDPFNA